MDGELIVEREVERPSEPGSPPSQLPLPWLIISLVILNWAVFLYSLYENNCPSKTPHDECLLVGVLGRFSFQPWEENTQFGPELSMLADLGALDWNFRKKQAKKWAKWHILTTIFFHTGLMDLVPDTTSLLYMGRKLEHEFGIGGSLWASLKFQEAVYVGGSSGVCGLTGGAFAELLINFNMHDEKFKTFLSLCLSAAINFAITLYRWADVTGNIGGLYLGFLLGFLLLIRRQPEGVCYKHKHSVFVPRQLILNYSQYQLVLWVVALISTITQFLYSLINYILR